MATAFNFTKKDIDALPLPPEGKRAFYYDTRTRGLAVQVTSSGAKSFYLVRKVRTVGKTERVYLGKYPDLSMEAVRKLAEKKNSEIADGRNPADEKRERKRAEAAAVERDKFDLTFGELFARYIAEKRTRIKTSQDMEDNYRRYLKSTWHRRKVSTIQRAEVQKWLADLAVNPEHPDKPRRHTANRSFDTFRAVVKWGIEKEIIRIDRLPYKGIDTFKLKARERFVAPGDEAQKVLDAINDEPNPILRHYFLVLMETGARKSNVLEMQWRHINWDLKLWTIENTKNDDTHEVPLTELALAVLHERMEAEKDEALIKLYGRENVRRWVFPGDGITGHLVSPHKAWKRMLERAGLWREDRSERLRPHDLRRTVGSYMAIAGVSPFVIAKALGHRSLAATKVYARLNQDPVRAALEKVKDLRELKTEAPASKVVPLRKRKK
ncbi:MAG TPA: site-specific integrase [Candidatus Obscuribacterales bacterium]